MSDIDKQLYDQVSRMIIECRSQDGQIDEWGERELRDDFLELISTAVREARIDEIKRYREAMTFAHITPSIYAAERIPELLSEEQS